MVFKDMVGGKCPRCGKGRLFTHRWWQIFHFSSMHTKCSSCNVRYEVEPGFFYGAMYLSYALSVGIMVVGGIFIYNVFDDPATIWYIAPITIISIIVVPFNFRIARVLYLFSFSGIKREL